MAGVGAAGAATGGSGGWAGAAAPLAGPGVNVEGSGGGAGGASLAKADSAAVSRDIRIDARMILKTIFISRNNKYWMRPHPVNSPIRCSVRTRLPCPFYRGSAQRRPASSSPRKSQRASPRIAHMTAGRSKEMTPHAASLAQRQRVCAQDTPRLCANSHRNERRGMLSTISPRNCAHRSGCTWIRTRDLSLIRAAL